MSLLAIFGLGALLSLPVLLLTSWLLDLAFKDSTSFGNLYRRQAFSRVKEEISYLSYYSKATNPQISGEEFKETHH